MRIVALVLALLTAVAHPAAVVFSNGGQDVKALKSTLDLNGQSKVLSGTTDPTAVAVNAPIGSVYLNSSNGKSYRKTDAGSTTNWVELGAGTGGSKNYITYNNFEGNATTGWSLAHSTLDATTKLPNQASGSWTSVTNLNMAVTSSSPLQGTYSLNYVSSGVSTAGDMLVSQAYTIDSEDQAKVLTFKLYYNVNTASSGNWSGTSSNSFGVAVYDVTNSTWVQPAGVFNVVQSSGVGYATGTFQTASNASQYRLAFYNVNATSSSVTIKLDDFFLGPQTAPLASFISDWTAYTPTGSWVSNTTYTGFYRVVGGDLEAEAKIALTGAPTATSLTVGNPSGQVCDSTKQVSQNTSTAAWYNSTGSAAGTGYKFYTTYASSTSVLVAYQSSVAAVGTAVNATSPATWANGDFLIVKWKCPLSGKSGMMTASNDTDTRKVALTVSPATATGTITGSDSVVTFSGTVAQDTHGAFSSGNTYTTPVSGTYNIAAQLEIAHVSVAVNNGIVASIYKNGALYGYGPMQKAASTSITPYYPTVSAKLVLNAGDTIQIRVSSQGTTPTFGNSVGGNSLNITRDSGPATIAATESVNARYMGATATITGSVSAVTYTTKDFDSHNSFSAGAYTIPVSGRYSYNAVIFLSAASAAVGNALQFQVLKNGSAINDLSPVYQSTQTLVSLSISDTASFLAGDVVTIKVASGATTPAISASNQRNYFSIARVGN